MTKKRTLIFVVCSLEMWLSNCHNTGWLSFATTLHHRCPTSLYIWCLSCVQTWPTLPCTGTPWVLLLFCAAPRNMFCFIMLIYVFFRNCSVTIEKWNVFSYECNIFVIFGSVGCSPVSGHCNTCLLRVMMIALQHILNRVNDSLYSYIYIYFIH